MRVTNKLILILIVLWILPILIYLFQAKNSYSEQLNQVENELKSLEVIEGLTFDHSNSDTIYVWAKQNNLMLLDSELILDPKLETYFLGQITIDLIPKIINELHTTVLSSESKEKSITLNSKYSKNNSLYYLFDKLNRYLERINRSTFLLNHHEELNKFVQSTIKNLELIRVKDKIEKTDTVIENLLQTRENGIKILKSYLLNRQFNYKLSTYTNISFLILTSLLTLFLSKQIILNYIKKIEREKQKLNNSELLIERSARLSFLGEMTSSIGHEIATPLTNLMALNEKLLRLINSEKTTKEDYSKLYEIQNKSLMKMSRILNSLRNLTKMDSKKEENTRIDLSNSIKETLDILNHKIISSKVNIENEIPINFFVTGRQTEIEQIIGNLIKNACDALASSSDRRIKIFYTDAGEHIKLHIVDSGKGIPEENQEKIFEPLFSTKLNSGGTGLGLSLSKKLAQSIQGDLELSQEKDPTHNGAHFILTLQK